MPSLLICSRVPLFLAVGKPLAVQRMSRQDEGFEAHVTEVHKQYIISLQVRS